MRLATHDHWWRRRSAPVQVRFTLRLRDQRSKWMQNGYKVYIDSYMTSNGPCFMVTWIIFTNHLLEVGLTQNRETQALQMLTTIDLWYFFMCEDLHEWKFIEIAFGWGSSHIRLHTTLAGPWLHYMISEDVFGTAFGHFLSGPHNFMVMALGFVCELWSGP
jgi:hypothetical protein